MDYEYKKLDKEGALQGLENPDCDTIECRMSVNGVKYGIVIKVDQDISRVAEFVRHSMIKTYRKLKIEAEGGSCKKQQ